MNKKAIFISEAAGWAVICSAAVFLHFAYELSGRSALGLLFGAVNESVWEHVKVFGAAYTGWALLQLIWLKVPFRRYVTAKCAGLYLLTGGMIVFYYGYTAITGTNILAVDIISSLVLTALAQFLSFRLETDDRVNGDLFAPSLMLIMLFYLMFFSFTIFPPRIGLFRDPISGGYGII